MGRSWPCLSWRPRLQHWVLTESPPPTRRCLTVIGHFGLAREPCSLGVFVSPLEGGPPLPIHLALRLECTLSHIGRLEWVRLPFPPPSSLGRLCAASCAWFEVML